MSMLTCSPPSSVEVGGIAYAINTDFRVGIQYETTMLDEGIPKEEKPLLALELYFPVIPHDIEEAFRLMQWFYICGQEKPKVTGRKGGNTQRTYSYEHDAPYIYAAFLAQYGIDLCEVEGLHWWKFRALLEGLSEGCLFQKIMGYRAMEIRDKMSKEEKEFYRSMKELYRLPVSKNEQEKVDAIQEALLNGGDLTGIL